MNKPEKEPTLLNRNQDVKLCLNCGFPNRSADTTCMYCKTSLVEDSGLVAWARHTFYVLKWRWQLNQRREASGRPGSGLPVLKGLGYFLVGVGFSGAGIYLFTGAIDENSFTNFVIALLLFLYGGFILKTLLTATRK
ncbi:MAG: hypothetical protein COV67_03870 [Nitrospinae bacterium CG11_big_fil_rev_8_21_14_0_20_56_8]|nr:MAG: hypothetical protein COV67_03870 [Nitrospinae bacterium CG11_big_fil_rev_8_21_14_0_20_56_8]